VGDGSVQGAASLLFAAALSAGGYLQAPPNAAYQLGTGDFTVEAWVCTAAPGGSGTLVGRKGTAGGPGNGGFLLVLGPDGTLKLATDNGFGYFQVVTAATAAGDGTWHFVAGVRQGASLTIYVDGIAQPGTSSGNGVPPLNVSNSQPLTLGTVAQTQEPYRYLTGQLDAVALWTGARSPATIAADMNTRFTGREAGLAGFWGFDFRDGRDTSPTAGDAAVTGNVTFLPPGAPIGEAITQAPVVTLVADDGQQVTATWTPVQQPMVTGYQLRLFDETGQPVSSAQGPGTQNSVPAPPAGSYSVQAQALGAGLTGPWSAAVPVVTAAPGDLSVAVTDTGIFASWNAASGAAGYRLALLAGGTAVETSDGTTTSGQVAIPADHTPAYTVAVRGQVGSPPVSTGPWSPAVPVLLAAPRLISVSYDGQNVEASWTALSPAPSGGYLAAVFSGAATVASAPGADSTAAIPATLAPGTAYVVQVRALEGQCQGPWSAPAPVLTTAPSGLVGGAIGGRVAARWQAASGATGYEAALSANATWGAPQPTETPAITFGGSIAAGTSYLVRARIVTGISSGPWADPVPGPFLRSGTVRYDGIGRMTSIEFPGVATTTYAYDAAGNITEVTVVPV
jgi:YD repeat-containing protein